MLRPAHGIYNPRQAGKRHQLLLDDLRLWTDGIIKQYKVKRVIVEAPFSGPNARAFMLACKMMGVIELTCEDHGILCVEATASQWRKHFIGFAQAPRKLPKQQRRDWLKKRAIAACKARGWPVETDDEADAIGLLDYALALEFPVYEEKSKGYTDGLDQG